MADGLRVLVVDEDPDSRVTTRKALQRGGFQIAGESGFGTQAVSLSLESAPDVVLIAVEEPTQRPLETAEALANAAPDTPILIYSSSVDTESVRQGMVFGARDYLAKPLQAARLREAVHHALEQEERRQMRRAGQLAGEVGRGTVIAVTGAKGGIGKSVASVNLALALQMETGKSVALVDADTQFGDIGTLLDITPPLTAADILRDPSRFDRATAAKYLFTHASGVNILATARDEDPWAACEPEVWRNIIDVLSQLHEFVVIDTSGAFDAFVRQVIASASLTLLITTGEVSSVRDTAAAIGRLNNWGVDMGRVHLVFNRGARASGVSKEDLTKAVGRDVFWEIPNDKAVPRSVQVGRPVVMEGRGNGLGQNMRALARLIAGTRSSLVVRPPSTSLLQRLISLRGRQHDADTPVAEPELQR